MQTLVRIRTTRCCCAPIWTGTHNSKAVPARLAEKVHAPSTDATGSGRTALHVSTKHSSVRSTPTTQSGLKSREIKNNMTSTPRNALARLKRLICDASVLQRIHDPASIELPHERREAGGSTIEEVPFHPCAVLECDKLSSNFQRVPARPNLRMLE